MYHPQKQVVFRPGALLVFGGVRVYVYILDIFYVFVLGQYFLAITPNHHPMEILPHNPSLLY